MKRKRNWKTTFFGITTTLGGVALILKGNVTEGVSTVLAGIGLIFAKDSTNENGS